MAFNPEATHKQMHPDGTDLVRTPDAPFGTATPAPRTFFTNVAEMIKRGRGRSLRKLATSFLPLNSQVLILPVQDDKLSDGGIVIPDTAVPKPSEGTVMAVGPGRIYEGRFVPTTVQPGDTVLFGKYAGTEYKLCGEDMRLMQEEEILGVIR